MNKVLPDAPEAKSLDLLAENVERLKELFPEAFVEGKIDFETLKGLLGGAVAETEEKYGLNWHGKRRARQIALTPSTGTLRPFPGESVDWDTTQSLLIEGDNLEVLKLLQKSYSGKVKLIYIDPPYNTGKDFVYPDDFRDGIKNYQMLTGQIDSDGRRMTSNAETSGRFHTDWLNLMYPRLMVARNLLAEEGIVVVSIDESERSNLAVLGNLVFGEENFAGEIVWKNSSKNDQDYISIQHEYFLVFVKNKQVNPGEWTEKKQGLDDIYKAFEGFRRQHGDDWKKIHQAALDWYGQFPPSNPIYDSKHYGWMDQRGVYFPDNISGPNHGQYRYDVPHPVTGLPCKEPASGWRYPPEKMRQMVDENRVHFGDDHTTVPNRKTYLKDTEYQSLTSLKFQDGRAASNRLAALFGSKVFTNPKDENLLAQLFSAFGLQNDDLILDFFAGSGSTYHAVVKLNQAKGSRCRCVLVQLPEDLNKILKTATGSAKQIARNAIDYLTSAGKPANVFELCAERVRKVIDDAQTDSLPLGDRLGFRLFRLDTSNVSPWDPTPEDLEGSLLNFVDHIKADRSEKDVLYELLLKLGLDLCVPIEVKDIDGKAVHSVGGGILMACLAERIGEDDAETLGRGIVEWNAELSPIGDVTCVFRDDAFEDDVAKTNLVAILEQGGIKNVRSI